ncbi:P-type DNA transfer ATPase VirB11 [Pantoea endophytica]|uniref:Type IV secretion system protein n=1 Tax=Pantoea sp. BJ2 TaxID=3141322 RepID=A0AAU7U4L9_9GAMM
MSEALAHLRDELFGHYLDMPGLTEIAVNRTNELFTKIGGVWQQHKADLTFNKLDTFSRALANFHGDNLSDTKPILSATLPTGERGQIVIPPACERDTMSITLRKPSTVRINHQAYVERGFYNRITGASKVENYRETLSTIYRDKDFPLFMRMALQHGLTMMFVGETGSGKTTYLKSLTEFIPRDLRIITIEDNPEVLLPDHPNHVHLFYPSEAGNSESAIVTSGSLLRACYRMNPDRILQTEVRGGEAWDFVKICTSGHEGSITSQHSGNPYEAITGLVERCYQNSECNNLPYSVLLSKVLNCIDVIASIEVEGDVRQIGEIYFKDVDKAAYMKRFREEIW